MQQEIGWSIGDQHHSWIAAKTHNWLPCMLAIAVIPAMFVKGTSHFMQSKASAAYR